MSTEILTPETLTFEHIKQWSGETMKKYMQIPSMREAIYRVVQTQPLEVVEQVAAQQTEVPAAPVEVPVVPVTEVPVIPVEVPVVPEPPKKIVLEYQVKDEEGNPIGRPTHLEASSEEELRNKMIEAHTQATRAFHRLKKQKVQSLRDVNQPAVSVQEPMSDAEMLLAIKDLKSDDPAKALEAHKKLTKAETDKVRAEAAQKEAQVSELRRQEAVSYAFLKAHQNDFNNCEANVNLIKDYFQENQLPWTLDNLEIAFHAMESELAPVVVSVASVRPANPEPIVQPVAQAAPTTLTAVAAAQPAPTVPTPVTPPANPAPAQPRPGVNGGIVPGQNSAPRPAATSKGITPEEIKSWDGPTMRAKMRNPLLRAEIERVAATMTRK